MLGELEAMKKSSNQRVRGGTLLTLLVAVVCITVAAADPKIYSIKADLPPEVVCNVTIIGEMPAGLIYLSESFNATGAGGMPEVEVSDPNNGTKDVSIVWNFGEVDNSENEDILIEFRAIVADIEANQNGTVLPPSTITLSWDDCNSGTTQTFSGEIEPVSVIEPDLAIKKRATGRDADFVIYEISIFHSLESRSPAYDVEILDLATEGTDYTPGSAEIVTGPTGSINESNPPNLKWNFDDVNLSWTSENPIILRYKAEVESSSRLDDSGGVLKWTSAAGDVPEDRDYTLAYNSDPSSSLNVEIFANLEGVTVGDLVSYYYTVENDGFNPLLDLSLEDETFGTIELDRTALLPGEIATGAYPDRIVTAEDLPGPIVNNAAATAIDYEGDIVTGTGTILLPFLDDPLSVTKIADKDEVNCGEVVNYTITITNTANPKPEVETLNPTNIVVEDIFSKAVEVISASPPPDSDGKWRSKEIGPGAKNASVITLTVRAPDEQDFEFDMVQSVHGTGFVNVRNEYTTSYQPYNLRNCVHVSFLNGTTNMTEKIAACEDVSVLGEPGTELFTREHGSGVYESEELVTVKTKTRSLSMEKDVLASHKTTTIGLYNNRTVTYSSKWTEEAKAKNKVTGASMSESYRYASYIDRESRMNLDKNESAMEINAEFEGMGHIGFLKLPANATPKSTPIFESREDYAGSFKVLEKIDGYGSSATSEKSASGSGSVAVDKWIGDSQRSYESGSGIYESEEIIETNTNYIAKDIKAVYEPLEQDTTGTFVINQSTRWTEGMWSRTPKTSFIGEEYTSADYLEKETVAKGLNEMDTEANFSGRARYRSVLKDDVDLDEQYEGDYSIQRKILFGSNPKYDHPHLNLAKEGYYHEEAIFNAKETILAGESKDKVITVATYTITLKNDGNQTLGPIYVKDLFPPRAKFINASVRPSKLTENSADWVLTHLAIGDESTIYLNLDVTDYRGDELVNRVEARAGLGLGDNWVEAKGFTALEIKWLKCCSSDTLSVTKTAQLDETKPNFVWYKIEIQNLANVTRVATVIDQIPEGMVFLDSKVPFSSHEGNLVTWNLTDLSPMENETIDYRVEALWSGQFVNYVQVDARSVDGATTSPIYASTSTTVTVSEFEGERPAPGWQPPDWGFICVGTSNDSLCEACEELDDN